MPSVHRGSQQPSAKELSYRFARSDFLLQSPFGKRSEQASRELLVVAAVVLLTLQVGLVPKEITFLGVKLELAQQVRLASSLGLLVLYMLVRFGLFAASDLALHRIRMERLRAGEYLQEEGVSEVGPVEAMHEPSPEAILERERRSEKAATFARVFNLWTDVVIQIVRWAWISLEFVLPIWLGLWALWQALVVGPPTVE